MKLYLSFLFIITTVPVGRDVSPPYVVSIIVKFELYLRIRWLKNNKLTRTASVLIYISVDNFL